MSNIRLHPEGAVFIPGKGKEKELAEVIKEYAVVLKAKGIVAPFDFGVFTKFNLGFEKAMDDSYDFISKAANDGDIEAEKALMKINKLLDYDFPNYFVVQTNARANKWYAEHGDIYAQGMLGDKYYYGRYVKQNNKTATYWYRKAAEQGVVAAQYNLAGCYELGRGVVQNKKKAIYWYRKAAEEGHWEAKRAVRRIELEAMLTDDELLTYKPTGIWEDEQESSWKDEYGVEYSADGKRLLDAPSDIEKYVVRDGTLVICDAAFCRNEKLSSITLPESIAVIGGWAFNSCYYLTEVIALL